MPYFLHGEYSIISVRFLGFCSLSTSLLVGCLCGQLLPRAFPSDLVFQFLGMAALVAFMAFEALFTFTFRLALSLFLFFSFNFHLLSSRVSVHLVQAISESEFILLIFIFLTPFPIGILIL